LVDATDAEIGEVFESRRRKIEIGDFASLTTIGEGNNDALAIVCYPDFPAAHGVSIGVSTIVTRIVIEEEVRDSSDIVGVLVDNTTSTQTGSVESALSGLCTSHEAGASTTATRGLGGNRRRRFMMGGSWLWFRSGLWRGSRVVLRGCRLWFGWLWCSMVNCRFGGDVGNGGGVLHY
jgi:hypothetical protein